MQYTQHWRDSWVPQFKPKTARWGLSLKVLNKVLSKIWVYQLGLLPFEVLSSSDDSVFFQNFKMAYNASTHKTNINNS